jgi:predicted RecA/RadA family phage recombinase
MATHKTGYTENWDLYSASAVTAGDVVLLGVDSDVVGVVTADIAAGGTGAASVTGVFEFDTDATIAQGSACYVDASGDITATTSDTYAGRCAKATASSKVWVSLNMMAAPAAS